MKFCLRILTLLLLALFLHLGFAAPAQAFCGFYVAKADTKLYNQASQVAIARDGNRTLLTMANDYQGAVKDFALVVPVPVVLQEDQVHIGESKTLERLDAFSAPRLVEYFDENPCLPDRRARSEAAFDSVRPVPFPSPSAQKLGVTVEAKFTVGEYDILILSAKESNGLATWLTQNGYRLPTGASQLLQPYLRQGMKFFVAKVNLQEFAKTGVQNLRPLQIAYESPKFMLPIRLGMINAQQAQDLIVYLLSPRGRVELTNYRTVKIPSDTEIPVFVKEKDKFSDFYKAMFQTAYTHEGRNIAFLEYAWNMANCDPCSATPLSPEELRQTGVFWLDTPQPQSSPLFSRRIAPARNVFITRLHVRYSRDKFPEDLTFQETSNQELFQGRYVLRHPFTGEPQCQAAQEYRRSLPQRFEQEAQTLAKLTGWNIQEIRKQLPQLQNTSLRWWQRLWQR